MWLEEARCNLPRKGERGQVTEGFTEPLENFAFSVRK